MKLAIADPPYPPHVTERFDRPDGSARIVTRSRARRWYGDGTRSAGEVPADFHPDAAEWDAPSKHRELLAHLVREYDGWAIATSSDGVGVYEPLPLGCERLAWVKPNASPGGGRLRQTVEAVLVYIPPSRRNRNAGMVPTHLIQTHGTGRFAGAKPEAWTRWVLDALGFDPAEDTVDDLFPGSGAVSSCIAAMAGGA